MIYFNDVKQRLKDKGVEVAHLEATFNTSLMLALDFPDVKEARKFLDRIDTDFTKGVKTVQPEDTKTGKGLSPYKVWTKKCRYCNAIFETSNRRQVYCDSPGHKQMFYCKKKAAQLHVKIVEILEREP